MGRVTRVFHRGETQTSLVKIETREPINEYVPFYLRDVGVLPVTVFNHHFYLPTDGWTNNLPKPKIFPPFLSPLPRFQFVERFDSTKSIATRIRDWRYFVKKIRSLAIGAHADVQNNGTMSKYNYGSSRMRFAHLAAFHTPRSLFASFILLPPIAIITHI